MTYKILIQDSATSIVYDIADLVAGVSFQTILNGQPGRLTLTLHADTGGALDVIKISEGSIISFMADNKGVFYGYVFTITINKSGSVNIIAYDQTRYLKNKDVFVSSGMTASQVFERICKTAYPAISEGGNTSLRYKVVTPSRYVVPDYFHDGKMLSQIIEHGIQLTNIAESKYYFIKDSFGILQFTELAQEKTNLIIGDRSLLTDFTYESSIDRETYNSIKITRNNKDTGKVDTWTVFDSATQLRWGKLQTVEKASDGLNQSQINEMARDMLRRYNRKSRTMKLPALGVNGINAGSGFRLSVDMLDINQDVWVLSATHNYEDDYHTMSLEVYI